MTIKTSEHLVLGSIYTRNDLQEKFKIKDATIRTGIFRPKGHGSIWLFITEEMTVSQNKKRAFRVRVSV